MLKNVGRQEGHIGQVGLDGSRVVVTHTAPARVCSSTCTTTVVSLTHFKSALAVDPVLGDW